MEICDIINETEEGPKDAIRALKKRLNGNRNYREVMLALTVLETCVKNCGHRFHVLVANRDFIDGVLVKIISPKSNPPTIVQDKVLALIQIARLRSELDVVRGNTKVMSEMLTEMVPGQEDSSDLELLQELHRTCRAMQQRVVELISRVCNEEVTEELLHPSLREKGSNDTGQADPFKMPVLSEVTEDNLIDLGPGSPAVTWARRVATYEDPQAVGVLASAVDGRKQSTEVIPVVQPSVMDDIEVWLRTDLKGDDLEEGVTSEEFDKFLEERAKAAE
ncbi:hypothetical protein E2I00_011481, partial [Balaenoptera physalus]